MIAKFSFLEGLLSIASNICLENMRPTFLIVDFLDILIVIDSGNHPALPCPFFFASRPVQPVPLLPPSLLLPAGRSVRVRCTCLTSRTVGMLVRSPSVGLPPSLLHDIYFAFGGQTDANGVWTEEGTDKRTSSISYEESELSYPLPSPFFPECPREEEEEEEEEEEVSLPPSEGCNNSLLLFFLWRWRAKTS